MTNDKQIMDVIADALEMHINNCIRESLASQESLRSDIRDMIEETVGDYVDSILGDRITEWMDECLEDRIAGRISITFD